MERGASYLRGFLPYALAAFMVGIAGGFSTVLGPAFVADIGIAYQNTTWTALAQAVSTAACAPILGRLGDAVGRYRTLLAGIVVYTLGNVLTLLASSLPVMMLARFVVGIGSAAIAPVVLAYIVTEFPEDKAAGGFSLYMLISSAAVVFGPALGGLMIRFSGWRGMIRMCILVCVLTGVACVLLPDRRTAARKKLSGFDRAGAVLVVIFFSLFLCMPAFAQTFGWTSAVFSGTAAAALAALAGLIFVERRASAPILSGRFLRRKPFVLSVLAMFLTQGLMQANMTNTIVFVNYTQPENGVISGYAISILYLGMSLGAVILGPLADRLEPKRVLMVSMVLTGIGCALMLWFSEEASVVLLASSLGLLGFGLGANGTIFMKVVLRDVSAADAGSGTGAYGLFRDLSAPFGVAVFVPMFTNRITAMTSAGTAAGVAAVSAVQTLAVTEIVCVLAAFLVIGMLPGLRK